MARSSVLVCIVLGGALLLPVAFSQPGLSDEFTPSPAEVKIEEALKSPTSLEFMETPLSDVVDFLKDCHKIEIQLDRKAMDDVGVASDTRITRNLKGVPLRSALKLMLRELDLTYMVQDDVLLITTPEQQDSRQIIRVYRVDDLTGSRDKCGSQKLKPEALAKMISTCVAPTTWGPVGGAGEIVPISPGDADVLVVTQSYEVHHRIAALLAHLREVAGIGESPRAPKPKK